MINFQVASSSAIQSTVSSLFSPLQIWLFPKVLLEDSFDEKWIPSSSEVELVCWPFLLSKVIFLSVELHIAHGAIVIWNVVCSPLLTEYFRCMSIHMFPHVLQLIDTGFVISCPCRLMIFKIVEPYILEGNFLFNALNCFTSMYASFRYIYCVSLFCENVSGIRKKLLLWALNNMFGPNVWPDDSQYRQQIFRI